MRPNKLISAAALVFAASCVDHRPIRNGLLDEQMYLNKTDLTGRNPKLADGVDDDGWLFKVTTVKASSPNFLGDYAFPGIESDSKYVKFRFKEGALQVLDGRKLQSDDPNDPNDDLSTTTDRVMLEFAGNHVDVKLRESLDGERTNYLEENTEEPWEKRQRFKIDFEKSSLDPVANIAWFYGQLVHDCARQISSNFVPKSYEWSPDDQSLSFSVEVNYELNIATIFGGCWSMVQQANGINTTTIEYRFSFYRPGPSSYKPEIIAEKSEVNKKYGAFQDLTIFRDEETGLLAAKSLLRRFDPQRETPVVFYFHPGFPQRFKPMWEDVKRETNRVLTEAGAKLRIDFKEWNDGGVERQFGDLRYSFLVWHQDIDTTLGLLGYGPSSSDPRTGELLSANVNLYNVGMDWYRFLSQDYLETFGGETRAAAAAAKMVSADTPWEQIPCDAGQTSAPVDQKNRLRSTLVEEMRRVMNLPAADPTRPAVDDFIPAPIRGKDAFLADYHRILPEVRFVEPGYNTYVYMPQPQMPITMMADRLDTEKTFMTSMSNIMLNRNPFEGMALASRDGIQAQHQFLENFRTWRKNHDQLTMEREMLLSRRNIEVFDPNDAISAIAGAARTCKADGFWESDSEFSERVVEKVVFRTAIHEFGHNLSLRHNFYGSVDAKHMRNGEISASVMDYVSPIEEVGSPRNWGAYDENALKWIYGGKEVRDQVMADDTLYCTDEHRFRSPLCSAFDLGITPAQIVLNQIERYDWLYAIRNRRSFRTFWDTGGYVGSVYNSVFPLLRMWYLAKFTWGYGGIQNTMKRLDQVGGHPVATDQEYDERSTDLYNDLQAANGLIEAFYDAVINQPAAFRNYQTEFDPYYGDILRIGIITDKIFTMFAFMDLQEVYNYDPNIYTYASLYDAPFGTRNGALAQRVLDDMLGSNYDTFPWFKYYAINIFAAVTNSNLVGSIELKDRIAIKRYENLAELTSEFGADVVTRATAQDNPSQTFVHDGQEYVYTYLADRAWHLVAGRSRSPVSYQFIKDYNESLRGGSTTEDTFGLKILLAYYEFYNNFQGF